MYRKTNIDLYSPISHIHNFRAVVAVAVAAAEVAVLAEAAAVVAAVAAAVAQF